MLEEEFGDSWRYTYRKELSGIAVVPFSFGSFHLDAFGQKRNLTGNLLYKEIVSYLQELDNPQTSWPSWEMNDQDTEIGK